MATRISMYGTPVDEWQAQQMTDREQQLLAEEQRRHEAQTVEHVALAQAHAIAAAAYCEAFVQVMLASTQVQWTREEVLVLLGMALRGR